MVIYCAFLEVRLSLYLLEGDLVLGHRTLCMEHFMDTSYYETHFRKLWFQICCGDLDQALEILPDWLFLDLGSGGQETL